MVSWHCETIDESIPEDQADIARVGFSVSNKLEGNRPEGGDADKLEHAVRCLVYSVKEDIIGF